MGEGAVLATVAAISELVDEDDELEDDDAELWRRVVAGVSGWTPSPSRPLVIDGLFELLVELPSWERWARGVLHQTLHDELSASHSQRLQLSAVGLMEASEITGWSKSLAFFSNSLAGRWNHASMLVFLVLEGWCCCCWDAAGGAASPHRAMRSACSLSWTRRAHAFSFMTTSAAEAARYSWSYVAEIPQRLLRCAEGKRSQRWRRKPWRA
jgi:hypothetical protein